ncbi:FAD-dependent oxidoreductase [Bacillus suaedaesalsae]|uniref:FAD-dependent oxidoreductase n=1 Tax=Bacillus suaedaesalsae TaxID=2810349 RepID=A0ABS2DKP0_9BACI|nr:FAD-dependent oxidoreductase [Bacillus suaedaesalsae]MBM6619067.1 FAD-dependent oxidoreductase [Bacillus suaedaesalsae]
MKRYYFPSILTMVALIILSIFIGEAHTNLLTIPVKEYRKDIKETNFDVIVVGGEPEGVAAAVASARNGAKTLLIEKRDGLGGVMTYGMLNFIDFSFDMNGEIANAGIFEEWHKLVGGEVSFDIKSGKDAFLYLIQKEKNISLSLTTELDGVILDNDGKSVLGVKVVDENGHHTYYAKRFIDSTQDAELAVEAGVPYFVGGEDIGEKEKNMAVTLMIHLKNIDWDQIKETAKKKTFGEAEVTSSVAWGFSTLHHFYKPSNPNTRLRGLNIAKQNDGTIYINALQIFGINGLDEKSKQYAIDIGKKETKNIVDYLRREFPGFEKAKISSFPKELYVRETIHVKSEYQLPITDVWGNKDHWDRIGFGSYPVDVQATSVNDYGYVITKPTQYSIPFRSLIPLGIENILVASKASGYSSLAAGSARIIPTGMTSAQAAGTAAALSVKSDLSFREMSKSKNIISELQAKLVDQGARLYPFELEFPYKGEWYYTALSKLLTYGLLVGGYENNLKENERFEKQSLFNMVQGGIKRISNDRYEEIQPILDAKREELSSKATMRRDEVLGLFLEILGHSSDGDVWRKSKEIGLVDEEIVSRIDTDREILRSEGFYMVSHLISIIEEKNNK